MAGRMNRYGNKLRRKKLMLLLLHTESARVKSPGSRVCDTVFSPSGSGRVRHLMYWFYQLLSYRTTKAKSRSMGIDIIRKRTIKPEERNRL